ncbi:hypothetical protein, partial [Klebsiella pneumoniae]
GKNSLNRLIRCVCGKKIGPDPRNFNQRVSLGRNDLLIRTFPSGTRIILSKIFHVESWLIHVLLGTFIGVTAPLIFYKLVVRYRLNFIFEYPSHKKITIV